MSEKTETKSIIKFFGKTAFILLCLNTLLWTFASFYTGFFFMGGVISPAGWGTEVGTDILWRVSGDSSFRNSFSIEEWCIFVILPWVVVYFFKKIK